MCSGGAYECHYSTVFIQTLQESIATVFLSQRVHEGIWIAGHYLKIILDQTVWVRKGAKQSRSEVLVQDFLIWALC